MIPMMWDLYVITECFLFDGEDDLFRIRDLRSVILIERLCSLPLLVEDNAENLKYVTATSIFFKLIVHSRVLTFGTIYAYPT
jgi:hypothetical protein